MTAVATSGPAVTAPWLGIWQARPSPSAPA
jgi:hypothetical protein